MNVTQNIEIHNKDKSRKYSFVASVENEVDASRIETSSEPSEMHKKMVNSPQLKRGFKRQPKSLVTNHCVGILALRVMKAGLLLGEQSHL